MTTGNALLVEEANRGTIFNDSIKYKNTKLLGSIHLRRRQICRLEKTSGSGAAQFRLGF